MEDPLRSEVKAARVLLAGNRARSMNGIFCPGLRSLACVLEKHLGKKHAALLEYDRALMKFITKDPKMKQLRRVESLHP